MPMRLFIGVPLPTDPRLAAVTAALEVEVAAKRVPADTWHVTLRFLGEVADPAPVVDALRAAVAGHAAMPFVARGLGAFQSPQRARIVWAKVEAEGLAKLAEAVVDATREMGRAPRQPFVAHATLARLRQPHDLRSYLAAHADDVLAEGVLDEVVLYRSVLGPAGARYERLASVPLEAA